MNEQPTAPVVSRIGPSSELYWEAPDIIDLGGIAYSRDVPRTEVMIGVSLTYEGIRTYTNGTRFIVRGLHDGFAWIADAAGPVDDPGFAVPLAAFRRARQVD